MLSCTESSGIRHLSIMNTQSDVDIRRGNKPQCFGLTATAIPEANSSQTGVSVRNAQSETEQWYVLRVSYGRAEKANEILKAKGIETHLSPTIKSKCRGDRHRGYGGRFRQWLDAAGIPPSYRSCGNGSAMRVSAAGFWAKSKDECISLATETEWLYRMIILTRNAVQEGASPHHLFLQRRETSHEHRQSGTVCGTHSKRTAAENVEKILGKMQIILKSLYICTRF